MAGKSDIQAGKAYVELYVKNSALVKGLNAAKDQLHGLGKNILAIGGVLSGLGAAIVTPLIGAVAKFSEMGSALNDMSERTGVAASSLAELGYAAKLGGSSLEAVEKALKFMAKSGKDVRDFDKVAAQIAAIEDPSKRAQAAIKNFGKAGTALLPIIGDLQALREEARQLGIVPTDESVKMADAIGDAWDTVKQVVDATIFNIGAALAPVLMPALDAVKNIAAAFSRWAKQNGEIIRTVALIAGGVLAVGTVITGIGALIFGLGTAFGLVAGAMTTVAGVIGGLLSPAALLVAAIAGGVYAFVRFTSAGQAAISGLLNIIMPAVDTIRTALGGIGDALIAGDLELAGQIAITALKLIFANGVAAIADLFGGLGDTVGTITNQLLKGDLSGAWSTVVSQMSKLWADFSLGVVKVFTAAASAVVSTWQSTVNRISDFLIDSSKAGGLRGKIASSIIGVDLAAEQERTNSLNASLGLKPQDIGEEAKAAARQQTDAVAAGIQEVIDSITQAAQDRADAAAGDLETRTAGGGDALRQQAADLAKELDELRKQAAAAKEAAGKGLGGPGKPDTSGLEEIKSSVSVGFSAAGLLAQAGGPQERIARGVEKFVEQQARTNELLQDMSDDELEVDA